MLPSAAELTYFLEVCNTLNVSRAAERLGMSQPSLSLAIKRLEEAVGMPLLVRHKQGVHLTPAGKQVLLNTRGLLQCWEHTKKEALASEQAVQGYFRLGCHSTVGVYLAPYFLPDLLETYPKLEIDLQHDISRKITEKVINLSLDIGIVINPVAHPDLIIRKIGSDEVTFWVGEGKRNIQNPKSQDAVILCHSELIQTQKLLKKMKTAGIMASRILNMNSLEVVASLTANGAGIGILPARVAKSLYPGILKRLPHAPSYLDELCLICRNENRNIRAIQAIIESIKRVFK